MRLNLRKCRQKSFFVPALILLCLLIGGVIIKRRKEITNPEHTHTQERKLELVLPTLVMACNEHALRRSMDSLTIFRTNAYIFPIIVTPYCSNEATLEVVKSFTDWDSTVTLLPKPKQTIDGESIEGRHYKFALNHVFKTLKYEAVIVLKDYLDISPDFFEYFLGTYALLKADPSIWCVSAWNDNCMEGLVDVSQPQLLHRTEFFPGMGWMLLSKTWEELELGAEGDDFEAYLHGSAIIRGRVCIRPELSRTYNFGEPPSTLRLLNTDFVAFTRLDLSYMLKKKEHIFVSFAYSRPVTEMEKVMNGSEMNKLRRNISVQIPYPNASTFGKYAQMLGLMKDFIHGIPRTGLHGIVQCYFKGHRMYFTPIRNLSKLQIPIVNTTDNMVKGKNISHQLISPLS